MPAALAGLALLTCCATDPVVVRELEDFDDSNPVMSDYACSVLTLLGCPPKLDDDALDSLEAMEPGAADGIEACCVDLVTAELLLRRARTKAHNEALPLWLEATTRALAAYEGMPTTPETRGDPRIAHAIQIANEALGMWIETLQEAPEGLDSRVVETRTEQFEFSIDAAAAAWGQVHFDRFLSADRLSISGFDGRHRRYGIGATLVGIGKPRDERVPHYFGEHGLFEPVTAVLERDGSRLTLRLLSPWEHDVVDYLGRPHTLAADFTAAYAYQLEVANLHTLADDGLLDPASLKDEQGLFLMQPYDPEKTPIVMIHGLWDSPISWRDVTNDLWAIPELRDRFQVWHYMYPTGSPILHIARELRASLLRTRDYLDPEGDDPASHDLVLLCYSMGGLIGKTMVQSSGDTIYDAQFRKPLDQLDLTPEDRALVEKTFFFEPVDWPTRAIFLAVPHRGSDVADSLIGRFGSFLISLPGRLVELDQRIRKRNRSALRDAVSLAPSSIDELSPDNPVLKALAKLPIHCTFHTIYGDIEFGPPITDGVVPAESARLAGAASELMVEGQHDLFTTRRIRTEIRRILLEHANAGTE